MTTNSLQIPRRAFLASAATATAITVLKPSLVFGAEANSVLDIGLIGCGGRGSWIAKLFADSGKYRFVACSDYFQDKVDAVGEKHKIDSSRRYTGLSGYKRLLDSKLDAVVIETPPYFHPEHASDAVDAGKHVYVAKPIAVDAPGCQTIAQAGQRATAKKQVFLVDFQTRADANFRDAVGQVHKGAIGPFVMAEAWYPWSGGGRGVPPATPEQQLRSWYYVLPISGDFIVEQSIHSLDLVTWMINADPLRARGTGGHKVRPPNSIYDHFAVTYWFPDDLVLSFSCIQSIPQVKDEIRARVFGANGVIDADYYTGVTLRGPETRVDAKVANLYESGTVVNINEFHDAILKGDCSNPTVVPSVRSNLTAVLGREAAYRGQELTLAALLKEGKKLEPNLKGLKS
ncbi:MAG: Gfo/Idh/MocA family oxidoreductase [Verrucomicrobia bacterium]|jgi:myo-inositol 2-dehydrogenase / D-chiro-inositol 1-dehydrogenase|nr:Gfo/Idh/MocA family oxidoreductase [Verrucomicrobiota bacterium]